MLDVLGKRVRKFANTSFAARDGEICVFVRDVVLTLKDTELDVSFIVLYEIQKDLCFCVTIGDY